MPAPSIPTAIDGIDILAAARSNDAFRRVIQTGVHEQVVVMTIPPEGEIGDEVHPHTDQVFLFVEGRGEATVDGLTNAVHPTELLFVHAGSRHNIRNRGPEALQLITIYAPPAHAPGTVHRTKAEADRAEH